LGIVSIKLDPIRENSKISEISLGGLPSQKRKANPEERRGKEPFDGTSKNSPSKLVPSYIFQDKRLTPLEALVKYLREKRKLSYYEISKLLSRNVRDIYKIYANAFDKSFTEIPLRISPSCFIPVSIFSNRKLSALEALVSYLKDLGLSYRQISVLLNRDERTIWTVYKRAIKKNGR